jgi:dTDP-4-amino-4,6-dideoxygalactose transaminase
VNDRSQFAQPDASRHRHADFTDHFAGVTRDDLQSVLLAEQVLARRYFFPGCHRMAPYAGSTIGDVTLPHSEHLASRVLCLPSGSGLDDRIIATIVGLIVFTIAQGAAVRARLHGDG